MFRPDVTSRRAYLAAMKGLALSSGPLPTTAGGQDKSFCPDPSGRDILATPEEVAAASCGDCKKLSILAVRRLLDSWLQTGHPKHVELCMTVSDSSEEHVFLRVDGRFVDPAVEAGMPVRRIGNFIAETVWQAPPSA